MVSSNWSEVSGRRAVVCGALDPPWLPERVTLPCCLPLPPVGHASSAASDLLRLLGKLKSWSSEKIRGGSTCAAQGGVELEIRAKEGEGKLGSLLSDGHVTSILSGCGHSREKKKMNRLQLRGNKCFYSSNLDAGTTIVRNECLYLWNDYSSLL